MHPSSIVARTKNFVADVNVNPRCLSQKRANFRGWGSALLVRSHDYCSLAGVFRDSLTVFLTNQSRRARLVSFISSSCCIRERTHPAKNSLCIVPSHLSLHAELCRRLWACAKLSLGTTTITTTGGKDRKRETRDDEELLMCMCVIRLSATQQYNFS